MSEPNCKTCTYASCSKGCDEYFKQLTVEREARQKAEAECAKFAEYNPSVKSYKIAAWQRDHWKQRAETAEADLKLSKIDFAEACEKVQKLEACIKASQEQEPVKASGKTYGEFGNYTFQSDVPELYKQPIIRPEVEELQRENAQRELNAKQLIAAYEKVIGENAELTRKLAEQQATLEICGSLLSTEVGKLELRGKEELTKLIEKAKRQAVPEGWQVVPKEETETMHDAVMSVLYKGVTRMNTQKLLDAYLSAAPQPERKE